MRDVLDAVHTADPQTLELFSKISQLPPEMMAHIHAMLATTETAAALPGAAAPGLSPAAAPDPTPAPPAEQASPRSPARRCGRSSS